MRCWRGVADGTIDCVASDHAPHLASEKELEFLYAPFGIVSLDCALGLYVKALIATGVIDWPAFATALRTIGFHGDIVMEPSWTNEPGWRPGQDSLEWACKARHVAAKLLDEINRREPRNEASWRDASAH